MVNSIELLHYNELAERKYIDNLAPVVIFAYNRVDHIIRTVESLSKNKYAENSTVIFFSDGYKEEKEGDKEKVEAVRKYIKDTEQLFGKVVVYERKKNYGLANNIIDGVTAVVNRFGKIIVLEDDICTSPFFLQYMNDALEIYKDVTDVMEIGGFMPIEINSEVPEGVFLPWTTSWGWATWKRSWRFFERNPEKLINSLTPKEIYKININGTDKGQWNQVLRNQKKEIYTWAVFYSIAVIRNHGRVLYPNVSMCKNIGFDGSGANCGASSINVFEKLANSCMALFPEKIEVDDDTVKQIMQYNIKNNKIRRKELYRSLPKKIILKLLKDKGEN